MGKFDGILLCSDLDGTLLSSDRSISKENLEAIEYFKAEGGMFTFVTGRMPFFIGDLCDTVRPNVPFGCVNGGGIYDCVKKDYVWLNGIESEAKDIARDVSDQIEDIGVQVTTFHKIYFCRENEVMKQFRAITHVENTVRDFCEIDEPLAKIVFGVTGEKMLNDLKASLKKHSLYDRFDYVQSEEYLFEILPKGSGKGAIMRELPNYVGRQVTKTVAVGDFNNDISMLKEADLGIAVSNACKELLEVADKVTVSNDEHAIREVINTLL